MRAVAARDAPGRVQCAYCFQTFEGGSATPTRTPSASLAALHARAGGICHLCGRPVALEAAGWAAASRDHLVPRSLGGGRGENLALAHRWCNGLRKDEPDVERARRIVRAVFAAGSVPRRMRHLVDIEPVALDLTAAGRGG